MRWTIIMLVVFVLSGCSGARQERAARAHLRQAVRLLENNEDSAALKEIDRAIAISPRRINTYFAAIAILLSSRRYDEASDYAEFALKSAASSRYFGRRLTIEEKLSLISLLAQARYKLGNAAEAARIYEKALKLKPDDPTVMNDLGYYYTEADRNLFYALSLVKKAVHRAPDNAAFVDSLGWAYYKLGRYEEAERELRRAVGLDPNSAELRYHFGVVYAKWGDAVRAKIELRKALELDPRFEPAKAELQKLGQDPKRLHNL